MIRFRIHPFHHADGWQPDQSRLMILGFFKRWRRERIRKHPFPETWRRIIEQNVPYYCHLTDDERQKLFGHVHVFLAEKRFEGCGGLEINDEICVTIAAQACVLLLHDPHDYYPGLESIVVYPSSFHVKTERTGTAGVVFEDQEEHEGEAWPWGTVVLAWDVILHDATDDPAGRNLVIHEFAHFLDQQDGGLDGTPDLRERSRYRSWARILGREYQTLLRDDELQRSTVIDRYGTKDPAEFFAVITECFFENPIQLQARHPELYAELKAFYRQDPAERRGKGGRGEG